MIPILWDVETPDFFELEQPAMPAPLRRPTSVRRPTAPSGGLWAAGERLTWVAGLVLALSSFMGWYAGSGVGMKLAVIGWHTGVLGKLVFFIGAGRRWRWSRCASRASSSAGVPESLLVLGLGALPRSSS